MNHAAFATFSAVDFIARRLRGRRPGNVTASARELDLTQSAVSRQIKALEVQLGAELFLRERQTVRLTLAGDSYAPRDPRSTSPNFERIDEPAR